MNELTKKEALFEYVLRQGDNCVVLGQRLGEWCGHGPALEEDIALTNVALDLFGQARLYLSYAAEHEGEGRTDDALAFLRDGREFRNLLLLEQPNRDFAYTMVRQFLFDVFHLELDKRLTASSDTRLSEIAEKSVKEITYHVRRSARWMIRLGDGTDVSHEKMQTALDELWLYTGEMFAMDAVDDLMLTAGIGVDLKTVRLPWDERVNAVLEEATLKRPDDGWMDSGGKNGRHTEHLGHMLAEMQHLQRAYPGAQW